ncbi:uncharacterized protein LOC117123695 [Anneissia japonica]|uniref:uncharacterized protein LOC117123695 n=1 Tax=Anneissia japonica TaxID=1529436 RepID=UPI0014258511|nr:uncharacterized protein LOC117123695 [Anneissia japonica]
MAENDMYVAAFNDIFRGEFIKCVDVMDMIVALGTLTVSDEENVRAVYKTEGNTSAVICLCERLCRKPNWKENIVKALRSDDIGKGDLADRIEEKFKEVKAGISNPLPFHQTCGDVSNSNQSLLPLSPQATVNINVNVYNGARPKETSQVVIDKAPTSDSAVFGIRPTSSVSTFLEKDRSNIFQLTKYEELLVGDTLDGKQKNVLIISPDEDETRSRILAHICITHLQNSQSGSGVKKLKVVYLTSTNRLGWLSNFGKYLSSFGIYTNLNDQKNITAESMEEYDVILSTSEIFERALTSEVLAFSDITLLILDECHLCCQSGHPFRSIIKSYLTEKLAANLALQVVGLTTSSNIHNHGDIKETEDNLSNLIGTLDAMCVSMITEEATINELYLQVYPQVTQLSVATRRKDDPFCRVISRMMFDIEQKLELKVGPLQRYSQNYGYHIAELRKQEKTQKKDDEEENGTIVLLNHLAVYNKVLQMNEMMRTKDAFAFLKKLYKEHDDGNEWLEELYQEHSSQLYKLSKEGDSKYENPRLAHLKREILAKSGGDFKAIIISEHHHVLEALHDWLISRPDFKNLHTQLLSTTDKSSEMESFNSGNKRLLLTSSAGLEGVKLIGVNMAVIFVSVMDGIRICQSDEDVTQELLDLVAQLQLTEVVKHLQNLPESVKLKNNQHKKLQILRENEVLEESISPKKNISENTRVEEFEVLKGVSGKRCSLDTNVRGQPSHEGEHDISEPMKSPVALPSSLKTKSKAVRVKEKDVLVESFPSLVNQIGEENEEGKNLSCKRYTVDKSVSSKGKSQLSEFKLHCRGSTGNGKCTTDTGTFACSLSDVRLMSQFNHVYKKKYWNWSKIIVKEHRDKTKRKDGTKKIHCKECGADWGNTFKLYPCLKLNNFNVKFPNGELKYFPQWKKLDVPIPPMKEDQ